MRDYKQTGIAWLYVNDLVDGLTEEEARAAQPSKVAAAFDLLDAAIRLIAREIPHDRLMAIHEEYLLAAYDVAASPFDSTIEHFREAWDLETVASLAASASWVQEGDGTENAERLTARLAMDFDSLSGRWFDWRAGEHDWPRESWAGDLPTVQEE